ncbi:NAD(P)/FAD-dependent oxidoreductase [Fibrella aquatilis]|uniref:FAD-dependent oxidoreductase n=1 Tax=Fibrella aquatilis TaxID=2817059 RepID=A0A939JV81_9BACT|nr:FAD-dependent oxidoreductase [Fibrella aquatilis]MBO0930577.1 FAD-dependent oxidoreductase [Fibrella aquatilis]
MSVADVLVVGQGVAGSVLALTLERYGCSVTVASSAALPAASAVAAGIVNPLTGRKLVRTWEADRLFPYLHEFYTAAEQQLNRSFFTPLCIYRPYRDEKERSDYQAIAANSDLAAYVGEPGDETVYGAVVSNPYGGLRVTQAGWVDLPAFVGAVRAYFVAKNRFLSADIQLDSLTIGADSVTYAGVRYRYVLFCEGPHGKANPLFSYLPYNVVKGEILTATVADYPVRDIINQGIFIMPINATTIRIGATYSWHELDWQTTGAGRTFLETKARALLRIPFTVTQQQAGIRPSTKDRRPFVGIHPQLPRIGIFGGMGTKGVSLAPYLANHFAGALWAGQEINEAVNISRFHSL